MVNIICQLTNNDLIKITNIITLGELRDQKPIWCVYTERVGVE